MDRQAPVIDKNSRILVTGGAGFIGSHLVEELLRHGPAVTVIDNLSTGSRDNLRHVLKRIRFIREDLARILGHGRLKPRDYTHIFHLAANSYLPPSLENPSFDFQLNLHNTFLLLEALRLTRNPPRLINISTGAVYGEPASFPSKETDPAVPISPYGASKLAAERYIAVFSRIYGIRALSLRLFSAYGPRQNKQVVFDILVKLRADPKHIRMLGDGSQVRDFIFVSDVVQALMLLAQTASAKGEVYNVGSGRPCSIDELIACWRKVCAVNPKITYSGSVRPGDPQRSEADIGKVKALGFGPKVSLEQGLAVIRDWHDGKLAGENY